MRVSHASLDDGFTAQVLTVEPTGDLTYLTCRAGQTDLIAIVAPEFRVAPGDVLHIAFDQDQIHLFDGSTELAIQPAAPASPEMVATSA
jgi:multiple sugar transport system ATP-binding protein